MYQTAVLDEAWETAMAWKQTGQPAVRKQRDRWVVRVDGIDTTTGKHAPKQLGTYQSQRAALAAARNARASDAGTDRGTLGWLVTRYAQGRTDVTDKAREQYEWAAGHITRGIGAIPLARLDREDISRWFDEVASGGKLSRRSLQICRNVLRAALNEAVEEGLIPRSPAARVGLPRTVAKPPKVKELEAWDADEVARFLEVIAGYRWELAFRLSVLYGMRRSEVIALRWDDLDTRRKTLRVDESLVGLKNGVAWGDAKNSRSRRQIPLDAETIRLFQKRRAEQAEERLASGADWEDNGLVFTTREGHLILPRSFDRSLLVQIRKAGLPNLTSHGLRHTAATHMVANASDLGELRAIADILGHSPEMLLNTYSHPLPKSQRAVVERLSSRV